MKNPTFEALHPRGNDGKFIKKGGTVRWLVDGIWVKGIVTGWSDDGQKIHVDRILKGGGKGKSESIDRQRIYTDRSAKATIDVTKMKKTSTPTAGSNPAAVYEDADGDRFYVKTPKSKDHVRNEDLANRIYLALGLPAPETAVSPDERAFASKMIDIQGDGNVGDLTAFGKKMNRGFVVDAWLANWDVAVHHNLAVTPDGEPFRVDNGGSMLFRARGERRNFGPSVGELQSMRDKPGYKGLTKADEIESAKLVLSITPDEIDAMVADSGLPSSLADTLKRRREFIARHYKLTLPETTPEGKAILEALPEIDADQADDAVADIPARAEALDEVISAEPAPYAVGSEVALLGMKKAGTSPFAKGVITKIDGDTFTVTSGKQSIEITRDADAMSGDGWEIMRPGGIPVESRYSDGSIPQVGDTVTHPKFGTGVFEKTAYPGYGIVAFESGERKAVSFASATPETSSSDGVEPAPAAKVARPKPRVAATSTTARAKQALDDLGTPYTEAEVRAMHAYATDPQNAAEVFVPSLGATGRLFDNTGTGSTVKVTVQVNGAASNVSVPIRQLLDPKKIDKEKAAAYLTIKKQLDEERAKARAERAAGLGDVAKVRKVREPGTMGDDEVIKMKSYGHDVELRPGQVLIKVTASRQYNQAASNSGKIVVYRVDLREGTFEPVATSGGYKVEYLADYSAVDYWLTATRGGNLKVEDITPAKLSAWNAENINADDIAEDYDFSKYTVARGIADSKIDLEPDDVVFFTASPEDRDTQSRAWSSDARAWRKRGDTWEHGTINGDLGSGGDGWREVTWEEVTNENDIEVLEGLASGEYHGWRWKAEYEDVTRPDGSVVRERKKVQADDGRSVNAVSDSMMVTVPSYSEDENTEGHPVPVLDGVPIFRTQDYSGYSYDMGAATLQRVTTSDIDEKQHAIKKLTKAKFRGSVMKAANVTAIEKSDDGAAKMAIVAGSPNAPVTHTLDIPEGGRVVQLDSRSGGRITLAYGPEQLQVVTTAGDLITDPVTAADYIQRQTRVNWNKSTSDYTGRDITPVELMGGSIDPDTVSVSWTYQHLLDTAGTKVSDTNSFWDGNNRYSETITFDALPVAEARKKVQGTSEPSPGQLIYVRETGKMFVADWSDAGWVSPVHARTMSVTGYREVKFTTTKDDKDMTVDIQVDADSILHGPAVSDEDKAYLDGLDRWADGVVRIDMVGASPDWLTSMVKNDAKPDEKAGSYRLPFHANGSVKVTGWWKGNGTPGTGGGVKKITADDVDDELDSKNLEFKLPGTKQGLLDGEFDEMIAAAVARAASAHDDTDTLPVSYTGIGTRRYGIVKDSTGQEHKDPLLSELVRELGAGELPLVVDDQKTFNQYVAQSPAKRLYRGLPSVAMRDQQLYGDFFAGDGVYGNGTYATDLRAGARSYGAHIAEVTIKPGTKITDADDVYEEWVDALGRSGDQLVDAMGEDWKTEDLVRVWKKLESGDQEGALSDIASLTGATVDQVRTSRALLPSGTSGATTEIKSKPHLLGVALASQWAARGYSVSITADGSSYGMARDIKVKVWTAGAAPGSDPDAMEFRVAPISSVSQLATARRVRSTGYNGDDSLETFFSIGSPGRQGDKPAKRLKVYGTPEWDRLVQVDARLAAIRDPGRFALLSGVDVLKVPRGGGGGGESYYVITHRGALIYKRPS